MAARPELAKHGWRVKPGFSGGASGGMGLEVGRPTTTDHVAGNAAKQKPAAARIIRLLLPRSAAVLTHANTTRHDYTRHHGAMRRCSGFWPAWLGGAASPVADAENDYLSPRNAVADDIGIGGQSKSIA